jgi:formate hydrogenlyase transcriptional activator
VHGIRQWDYNSRMASTGQSSEQARQAQDVDAIPALAWSARPDGSVEFFSRRWLDYTGLSTEEASNWGWTAALHTEDRDGLLDFWRHLLDSGEAGEIEARLRRCDGDYRWFLFRVEPVRDNHGDIFKWYGANTDIEDRKRAEALLAAEKRTLEMIANGACLADILEGLCETIDAQARNTKSSVMLMDADGMHLRPAAGPRLPKGWLEAITPLKIGPCVGSCGTAASLKQPVIVSDVAADPLWADYRDLALSHGLRAVWSQPLLSKNQEILGTFCVAYAEPRTPNETDLRLIKGAGHIAVIAIEGERSQEALRSAFEEIRNSEARLRKIIDTIPTLAWCTLPDGTGIFWNRRWYEYTGLSLEVVRGWGWQDAIHPEDLKEITDKWLGFLAAGQPGEVEGRLRRFDGVYRWFLFRAEPLRDESGNIVNWYGTDTDIDDLKRAEAKLRKDEEELRRMTDAIPQSIIVLNPDGKAIYANRVALEYSGLSLDDLQTDDFRARVFHPDDVQRLREERYKALSDTVPFENEQRALGKDGKYRWLLIRYNPLLDESGKVIRWYATGTDIDDRKRAEDRLRNETVALREQIDRDSMFEDIVGSSEALRKVLRQVDKVAHSDSTVLILGETGTGKELIARAIHKRSNRRERAFIGVNCAAIPASLIASELFGHEKGAFTGATQRRLGRFESANGGTIFLDEVGDLPTEIQIALLRVLQEREIERVGSNSPIPVDVRVLAATHRDLNALVAEGKFRQDLLYRLNVVPIEMPSLRDRAGDISLLVEYFIDRFGKKAGKKFRTIDRRTLKLLQAYGWPGNVRELQNVIERAVILSEGDIFCVDETWLKRQAPQIAGPTAALNSALQRQEKEMIEAALAESAGRVSGPGGAATKLGLPRPTLDAKIRRLGINKYRFKVLQSN